MELALQLIQEAKEQRLTRLDLGKCGLTELPDELFELTWLEELILSDRYWSYSLSERKGEWINSQNEGEANNLKSINPKIEILSANEIPKWAGLRRVTKLYINSQNNLSDLTPLKDLTQLQKLYVYSTQVSDLTPLKDLTQLQNLYVSSTQVSDLTPLKDLTQLQQLYVSSTQVSDLTPLKDLTQLQQLYVYSTQVSDLTPLKDLTQLQQLDVSSTQVSDLTPLKDLTQLQKLDVYSTQVSDLTPLKDLTQLQKLDVSSTQVSDLTPLKDLTQLQLLYIHSTSIEDISVLSNFKSLQTLSMDKTKVIDLKPLEELHNLQKIDLTYNQVYDLSPLKTIIEKGIDVKWSEWEGDDKNGIYVKDCPLNNPPKAIIKKGKDAILNYFNKPKDYLFEARVLVLGEPRAGKTTLRHKLKSHNASLPEEKNSTKGIEIEIENYKCTLDKDGNKQKMHYYLWDFGGQDYYRLFHQLFVSEQAVYIIVTDTNKDTNEAEENLEFWLDTIERLAKDKKGQYGPVILLQNAKTNREGKNYYDVKKRYTFWQQTEDFTINLGQIAENSEEHSFAELKKFKQFKAYLENSFHQLEHIGMEMPSDWVKVRKAIAKQTKDNYISIEEFRKICTKNNVKNVKEQDDLCGILHNLGFLLYYGETALKSMVILNKEWATDALYRVLDDKKVKQNVGWFKIEDAATIWDDEKYKDRTNELLLLMKEYKIVYFNDAAQKYIVPTKLPESTEGLPEWNKQNNVRLHLQYDWLPRAIGTQLIVSLHEFLVSLINGNDWIWRKGAVLNGKKLDLTDVEVLIEDNWKDKRIEINARGNHSEYLIREIMKEWRKVHEPYEGKVKVTQKILCNCKDCLQASTPSFYTYDQVLKAKEKNKPLYCNNALETFDSNEILRGVFDETTVLADTFEMKGGRISEELKNLIVSGNIKEALDKLPEDEYVINLKLRLNDLRKSELKNTISFDEANRERNKIVDDLLEMFDYKSGIREMGQHIKSKYLDRTSRLKGEKEDAKPLTKTVIHNYYNSQVYQSDKIGKVEYNNSLGISQEEFDILKRQVAQLTPEKQEELKVIILEAETPTTEEQKLSIGTRIYNWLNINSEDITKELTAATLYEGLKYLFTS
jgi:internalin A